MKVTKNSETFFHIIEIEMLMIFSCLHDDLHLQLFKDVLCCELKWLYVLSTSVSGWQKISIQALNSQEGESGRGTGYGLTQP
jgi:hypothetical protein